MTPYYEDDFATIYHGDCREVLPTIDSSTVDLLLTDPPYGIGLDTDNRRYGTAGIDARQVNHPRIVGDNLPFDPSGLLAFPRVFLFGANYYRSALPVTVGGWLLWDKVCRNDAKRYEGWSDGELAWSNVFRGVKVFRHAWNGFGRSSENSFHVHPAQKPVVLMRWILDRWTEPGGLIRGPVHGERAGCSCSQGLRSPLRRRRDRGAVLRDSREAPGPRGSRLRWCGLMPDHDVIEQAGTRIRCRCDRVFDCETVGESLARHRMHHGIETARQALAGRPHLELVPEPEGTTDGP